MSKRRVRAQSKIYGFNPWVDQVNAIDQIMEDTGERNVLRKLVDEALDARRKKSQSAPPTENSDDAGVRLQTIEKLLMRLVRQSDTSFRIQDVCLALLQDILAEAYATRRLLWESLPLPQLRDKGIDVNELEHQFVLQEARAKNYAYGEAERIMQSQDREMSSLSYTSGNTLASTSNAVGSDAAERKHRPSTEPANTNL